MTSETYLSTSKYPLLRLLNYMRGYRKDYNLALLYSVLNKLFDILPEILLGVAVNVVVDQKNSWVSQWTGIDDLMTQLFILGFATFLIWVLESIFQYLYSVKWQNLAQNVEHQLRVDVYDHIQKSKIEDIEATSLGELISTINDDINQMERFLEDGVNQIVQLIVSTLLIGLVFLYLSPLITLFAVVPIPFIIIGAFYFQHRLQARFLKVRQMAANISTTLTRNILGLMTIKTYTTEAYEKERLSKASKDYQQANYDTIRISAMIKPIIRMFVLTGFLFTMLIGGYLAIEGTMNVGVFSMLIFLSQRLLWPFDTLAQITINYQRVMASTTRVLNLMTWPIEKQNSGVASKSFNENQEDDQEGGQDIVFKNIHFKYPHSTVDVFNNFNLSIPAKNTVGFVGESGSGKTTLITLLCRFYEPEQGQLLFGEHDIANFDLSWWRKQSALVSQEPFLFDGTIRENIVYGAFEQSDEAVIRAATISGIHEFVATLPEGYDTNVGQRGVLLSGGQKQRISIARAIIKDAPILILDEATSAVDNETELAIQRAIEQLSHHKTTIIIAHRLSTIRHADKIYVIDKGQIIEEGQHEALLALEGKYARLWGIQTGVWVD
jgi:ATP-binding cassette, subfamily B, bacterial